MHPLVRLAKFAVETYIKEGKIILPPKDFPKEFLEKRAGTFVTITKEGNLRGCIGTYLPIRENIAKEVIFNAIAAATEDWRFGPINEKELPYLSFTVYILQKPELIKDISELDPKKYGVIVRTIPISKNGKILLNGKFTPKTGLLLPDLEGVDSVEKQILIACKKAGINPEKERFLIYRFSVEKFK
jgi:AmmeMemoRadiSam system protein A